MGFDKTRHADHAFAVDDFGAWRNEILTYRDDGTVADMDVAAEQICSSIDRT
jgi:hypothetical protein